jgi:hypothetical protein
MRRGNGNFSVKILVAVALNSPRGGRPVFAAARASVVSKIHWLVGRMECLSLVPGLTLVQHMVQECLGTPP